MFENRLRAGLVTHTHHANKSSRWAE